MKFKVTVTRIDEYEIEIDETVWTPSELKDWAKTFFPTESLAEFAKHLAGAVMSNGSANGFMEGFGYVKTYRSDGSVREQFGALKKVEESQYTTGLSVTPISEDEDFDYEVEEI